MTDVSIALFADLFGPPLPPKRRTLLVGATLTAALTAAALTWWLAQRISR